MASTSTEVTISISIYRGWLVTVAADVLITGSADNGKALDAISEVAGGVLGVARVENEAGVGGHWQW